MRTKKIDKNQIDDEEEERGGWRLQSVRRSSERQFHYKLGGFELPRVLRLGGLWWFKICVFLIVCPFCAITKGSNRECACRP